MKAVMISIRPKWCELIANGEKTIEIRKTRPKLTPPFKCYIYESQGNKYSWNVKAETIANNDEDRYLDCKRGAPDVKRTKNGTPYFSYGRMSVIGEFVVNGITYLGNIATDPWKYLSGSTHEQHKRLVTYNACMTESECIAYGGQYGWHISDLVIYDKPKELSEFKKHNRHCHYEHLGLATPKCSECKECQLERPPQSWCYVEEQT